MANLSSALSAVFRDRDFFVHDGKRLRRFRVSASLQAFFFAMLMALVGWSAYSAARIASSLASPIAPAIAAGPANAKYKAQIAALAAETKRKVAEIEQRQLALAAALETRNIDPATLRRLGFYPSVVNKGVGGPFDAEKGDPTFKQLFTSWKKLDNLHDGAIAIPSDKPVKTAAFTSGYGVRSDPFRGRSAMHSGIDLAGPSGTPIYATADGVVERAGWNSGGYGNLIEIDHGRGIETRYGHLSKVLVKDGQKIKRGELIGRMGSTGRSTGSHLHYEVRIDGRAVNPVPFMKATDYLVAMQRDVGSKAMDQVALGGPGGAKK